jgi:aquaporin Z
MEAAGLGGFMLSALLFVAILEHPASPVRQAVPGTDLRRVLVGLAMGMTAVALIYSPWGRRSGAHLNPAVTFAFWRLGRVRGRQAATYALGQFVGAALAVLGASLLADRVLGDPTVRYAATVPGAAGIAWAALAEFGIAFLLMSVVLRAIATPRLEKHTGWIAGALVATYIALEAPVSGMSLNPARSLASALGADIWKGLWIYFVAPPLGMLAAAELYRRWAARPAGCAKLFHPDTVSCPFCGHEPVPVRVATRGSGSRRHP